MTTRSSYAYSLPRLLVRSTRLGTREHWKKPFNAQTWSIGRPRDRDFHTSGVLRLDDHYATLELQPGAAASDIKKSFYKLSKIHHPDRNPEKQEEASKRFVAISDAYHVLGDEKKREKYDQELNQARGGGRSQSSAGGGSGFSPGGRKASGLSRRRGTFRGPPPSFYRSGGWGGSQDKRRANQGADPREAEARRQQQQQAAGSSGPHAGKTGDWPFATDPNDVGHFDREGHFKTTSTVEEQLRKGRTKRRNIFSSGDDMIDDESSLAVFAKFLQVTGIIAVGIGGSVLLFGR